mgnify:CR=1 FL=1
MESLSYLFTVDSVGELFAVVLKFWSFAFGVDIWVLLIVWIQAIKTIASELYEILLITDFTVYPADL